MLIEGLKMEGNLGRVKEDSTKEEVFAQSLGKESKASRRRT